MGPSIKEDDSNSTLLHNVEAGHPIYGNNVGQPPAIQTCFFKILLIIINKKKKKRRRGNNYYL
jgi:hypothetical protein